MPSIDLGALANFAEGKPERVTASDRALLVVRRGMPSMRCAISVPIRGRAYRMVT